MLMLSLDDAVKVTQWLIEDGMNDEEIIRQELEQKCWTKPLRQVPTIEPEPQRIGRWIDHAEDGYVECPFCHSATNCEDNISDLHFCFSCGARMEGD